MITMRKSINGFLFPYMVMGLRLAVLRAAGAPLKTTTTHNNLRHCRVSFTSFAWQQPFSKELHVLNRNQNYVEDREMHSSETFPLIKIRFPNIVAVLVSLSNLDELFMSLRTKRQTQIPETSVWYSAAYRDETKNKQSNQLYPNIRLFRVIN